MTPPFQGTPANIRINLFCQNLASLCYIIVADSIVYLHSNFRGGLRKTHVVWNTVRNGPSRSSKVVDFDTNRKRVCDFLWVINSNLAPILPRFRDIGGFRIIATPPLFHPNFRGVLFGLYCRCCGSEERRPWANYSCNDFRSSPTYMPSIHQRHRQRHGRTDRRTDGGTDDIR